MSTTWFKLSATAAMVSAAVACGSSHDSSPSSAYERGTVGSSGASGHGQSGFGGGAGSPPFVGGGAGGNAGAGGLSGGDPGRPPGGADAGGDRYQAVGTNPFVLTAHDPLSTFAADVDTASYDLFRRDVNLGGLPSPDSVRLEEYVNNFRYAYPPPDPNGPHPFRIHLAAAPHLLERGTLLMRVGVQARAPAPLEKRPTNLVFLVDTSGSMSSQDKLPLVQYTLRETLSVLEPTDSVSIVSYAGDVAVRLTPTTVANRSQIEQAISGLTSAGSTNGAGGIQLAYAQAQAAYIQGGINHVLLCTDGDFNVGVSSTPELVKLIEEKRRTGVTLTVLGYGVGNLNDAMMEAISNKGNGVYGVISNPDQATRYVHERLLSTFDMVAKDLKLQVEFNADRVFAYRLLGYENRAIADNNFRNDVIDAGEVGAGHRVTAFYEVVPQGGTVPANASAPAVVDGAAYSGPREVAATEIALVKVRYKLVDATEADAAIEVSSSLSPTQIAPAFSAADLDMQWALAIAAFAETLKRSPYADPGHLDVIGNIASAQGSADADRAEFLQLFRLARPRIAGNSP